MGYKDRETRRMEYRSAERQAEDRAERGGTTEMNPLVALVGLCGLLILVVIIAAVFLIAQTMAIVIGLLALPFEACGLTGWVATKLGIKDYTPKVGGILVGLSKKVFKAFSGSFTNTKKNVPVDETRNEQQLGSSAQDGDITPPLVNNSSITHAADQAVDSVDKTTVVGDGVISVAVQSDRDKSQPKSVI